MSNPPTESSDAKTRNPKSGLRVHITTAGITAILAGIPGIYAAVRGEPTAEKAYKTISYTINKQIDYLQTVNDRLARLEGREEGYQLGKLTAELELRNKEIDALKRQISENKPSLSKAIEPTTVKCDVGFTVDIDGKCKRIHKSLAAKVLKDKQALLGSLANEKRKRYESEKIKKLLELKVKTISSQQSQLKLQKLPPSM